MKSPCFILLRSIALWFGWLSKNFYNRSASYTQSFLSALKYLVILDIGEDFHPDEIPSIGPLGKAILYRRRCYIWHFQSHVSIERCYGNIRWYVVRRFSTIEMVWRDYWVLRQQCGDRVAKKLNQSSNKHSKCEQAEQRGNLFLVVSENGNHRHINATEIDRNR